MVILIDNLNLRILKLVKNIKRAEYWAEILIPVNDFKVINGTNQRDFSGYTEIEVKMLWQNSYGSDPGNSRSYGQLLKDLVAYVADMEEDPTPLEELQARLGRELGPVDPAPVPETRAPKSRGKAPAGLSRPKEGTTTGRVWAAADSLLASMPDGQLPTKAEVAALLPEVNPATVGTQYSKWKRSIMQGN